MTRKHFDKVAQVIRTHRQEDNGFSSGVIASIADSMACIFEAENPRFDRARFFTACGLNEDGDGWEI